jgi:hypothetical protein
MKKSTNNVVKNSNWTRTKYANIYNTPYGTYRVRITFNGTEYQKGGFTTMKDALSYRNFLTNK